MSGSSKIAFGEFHVDLRARRLWRGDVVVPLRPKPWTLLRYLLEHPGRVVLREEIASVVWPDVHVGEDSINKVVSELRTALGESARSPRLLETVHRIGVRFLGPVCEVSAGATDRTGDESARHATPSEQTLIGRSGELRFLQEKLERAHEGSRQTVFVTGEGGIGKSTLVREFVEHCGLEARPPLVLVGHSAARMAVSDAYGPFLDAISTLRRDGTASTLDALLRTHAPQWNAQLPGDERGEGDAGGEASDASRMLREGVLLVEGLASERTLIVVLEDLHDADHATTDLVAMLASRRVAARILLVGTLRGSDARSAGHPIASVCADLELKGLASNVAVTPLPVRDVANLLANRFGPLADLESMATLLVARSGGNPLFLGALLEYLVSSGAITRTDGRWTLTTPLANLVDVVPDQLRTLLETVIAALPRRTVEMLEAAAAAGLEFDARAVAAALECDPAEIEDECDGLVAAERLLRFVADSRWNDGSRGSQYVFVHQLYQGALYARSMTSTRKLQHLRIAQRLEAGAGPDAQTIAGELAMHFARGGAESRAVSYLRKAAERANRRGAHHDAVSLLRQALAFFEPSPVDDRRALRLLLVLLALSGSVSLVSGFVDPEVGALLDRAGELSERLQLLPAAFLVEFGHYTAHLMRSNIDATLESASRLTAIAERSGLAPLNGAARGAEGWALFHAGSFASAREHFDGALESKIDATAFDDIGAMASISDLGTLALLGRAFSAAMLGDRDAANSDLEAAAAYTAAGRSGDRAMTFALSSLLRALLGEQEHSAADAACAARLVDEGGQGPPWSLFAAILTALMATPFDARELTARMRIYEDHGYRLTLSAMRLLAAARLLSIGDTSAAASMLEDSARAMPGTERCWAAEELRVRAELMWARGDGDPMQVESLFCEALQLAREQKARRWEDLAAASYARFRSSRRTDGHTPL